MARWFGLLLIDKTANHRSPEPYELDLRGRPTQEFLLAYSVATNAPPFLMMTLIRHL